MRSIAYLALGANIGNKEANLQSAVQMLDQGACIVTDASSLYRTKPVGYLDQPDFLNAVVKLETQLNPHELLLLCKSIERSIGRQRTIRWGPRVIDIDILLYDEIRLASPELTLPHPEMLKRAFVLVPLAEIASTLLVTDNLTVLQAVGRIDTGGVILYRDSNWIMG